MKITSQHISRQIIIITSNFICRQLTFTLFFSLAKTNSIKPERPFISVTHIHITPQNIWLRLRKTSKPQHTSLLVEKNFHRPTHFLTNGYNLPTNRMESGVIMVSCKYVTSSEEGVSELDMGNGLTARDNHCPVSILRKYSCLV